MPPFTTVYAEIVFLPQSQVPDNFPQTSIPHLMVKRLSLPIMGKGAVSLSLLLSLPSPDGKTTPSSTTHFYISYSPYR